jgi:hypothetical protein
LAAKNHTFSAGYLFSMLMAADYLSQVLPAIYIK